MIVNEISLVIQNIISFFQSLFLIFNPEIKTEILLETFTSRKTIYQKPRIPLLQEIDGVRKEKERLTIACFMSFSVIICIIIGSGEVVYLHFFFNIGLQVIYLSSLLQIIYF